MQKPFMLLLRNANSLVVMESMQHLDSPSILHSLTIQNLTIMMMISFLLSCFNWNFAPKHLILYAFLSPIMNSFRVSSGHYCILKQPLSCAGGSTPRVPWGRPPSPGSLGLPGLLPQPQIPKYPKYLWRC
jgi:hypothetical protein